MKGFFWNSRGLSDLAKYQYISDAVKEHNLDFIVVMETGKQDMSKTNLNRLSGGVDFVWHCQPPKGRSGDILLGVNATILVISMIVEGEFYIKFHLCNKLDSFKWILMAVYGPAQDNFKTAFLSELVWACQQNPPHTIIGGDFNILRHSKEKNKDRFNDRWPFLFNAVIDSFDLREIELTSHQFTWASFLPNPTFEKLDRVLMTTEWEFKYPLVLVHALDWVSDHTPLILDTDTSAFMGNGTRFRLELSSFCHDDFCERVAEIWNKPIRGNNAVQRWNNKLSALRRYLHRWAKHKFGTYKQAKVSLQRYPHCSVNLKTLRHP
jgi:exonuclease III